jgi:redox-sensitive bicupin YhaK (pirin superfamily)
MIQIHSANDRGHFRNHWLDARFSFEFGTYQNAQRQSYSDLLVLNDDIVAPGGGFSPHGHSNVEVMSYPLLGQVEHCDNSGNTATLGYGDVHLMRAGSAIVHSEMNASSSESEHHLQWWIAPAHKDATPSYQKTHFEREAKQDRLCLIASPGGEAGSLRIDQDIRIYAAIVGDRRIEYLMPRHRRAYLHVAYGELTLNERALCAGDGVKIEDIERLQLRSATNAEILLFDLR